MSYQRTLILLSSIILLGFASANVDKNTISGLENCSYRNFVTTAYYSPLQEQVLYGLGNEYAEKIMNGQGVQTASGVAPEVGHIAAPPSYDFGDYVILPGIGVFTVTDRGGWIREDRAEHHKIDIYVGKGDEGVINALTRGRQIHGGYHCPQEEIDIDQNIIGFNNNAIPTYKYFLTMLMTNIKLEQGRKDAVVYALQKNLAKLGYTKQEHITGLFGPITKQAICNFQIDYQVVSATSQDCGTYGPQTQKKLAQVLKQKKLYPSNFRSQTSMDHLIEHIKNINQKIHG